MNRFLNLLFCLCLLSSCNNDSIDVVFTGQELENYKKIKEDDDPPKYKWGYFSENGKLVIKDLYDDNRDFKNGYAAVQKGGLWGMINKNGKEIIPRRYKSISPCVCDRVIARDLVDKFHIYSCDGSLIKDSLAYDYIYPYADDLARVSDGQVTGFLDKKGNILLALKYKNSTDMKNSHAVIHEDNKQYIIDKSGHRLTPTSYDKLWYNGGQYIRYKLNDKYGYLDGSTFLDKGWGPYDHCFDFFGDYAVVMINGKYNLIDTVGQMTFLPYTYIDIGGEGKWIYASNSKFGFLKNDGSILTLPQYDLLHRYAEDRAVYATNDLWGYLDENGAPYIIPQYPLAWDFKNGYARAIYENGFGFINKEGDDPYNIRFMEVRDFYENLARVQVFR